MTDTLQKKRPRNKRGRSSAEEVEIINYCELEEAHLQKEKPSTEMLTTPNEVARGITKKVTDINHYQQHRAISLGKIFSYRKRIK